VGELKGSNQGDQVPKTGWLSRGWEAKIGDTIDLGWQELPSLASQGRFG